MSGSWRLFAVHDLLLFSTAASAVAIDLAIVIAAVAMG
jgi:hypothetical protein